VEAAGGVVFLTLDVKHELRRQVLDDVQETWSNDDPEILRSAPLDISERSSLRTIFALIAMGGASGDLRVRDAW
jgi:hypothetical protein